MNTDQVKGRLKELAGKTKKAAGRILRDDTLKQKGRLQETAGPVSAAFHLWRLQGNVEEVTPGIRSAPLICPLSAAGPETSS